MARINILTHSNYFYQLDEQLFQIAKDYGVEAFLVVYVIWTNRDDIKRAIARFYKDRHADREDRREADQDIQKSKLDFKFQERATEQLQKYQERHAALDIIREQNRWAQKEFGELSNDVKMTKNQLTMLFGVVSEMRDDIREIKQRANRH